MKNIVFAGMLALLFSGCSFFKVEPYQEIHRFDPPCPENAEPLVLPELGLVQNLTPAGKKMLFRRQAVQAENPSEQWSQLPEAMLRRYILNRCDPARQMPGVVSLRIIAFDLDTGRQQAEMIIDAAYGRNRRSFRAAAPLPAFDGNTAAMAAASCFEDLTRQLAAWCRTVAPGQTK